MVLINNPPSVKSQTVTLNAINQAVNTYPVCEAWALFCAQVYVDFNLFDSQSLILLSQMGVALGKVFDYIALQVPQEVTATRYISRFSTTSRDLAYNARVAALNSFGGLKRVQLNNAAVSALSQLAQWDEAQSLYAPANPSSVGYALVQGASIIDSGGNQ